MYRQNITEHNILYIKKHVHGGQRRVRSVTTFDANIKQALLNSDVLDVVDCR